MSKNVNLPEIKQSTIDTLHTYFSPSTWDEYLKQGETIIKGELPAFHKYIEAQLLLVPEEAREQARKAIYAVLSLVVYQNTLDDAPSISTSGYLSPFR